MSVSVGDYGRPLLIMFLNFGWATEVNHRTGNEFNLFLQEAPSALSLPHSALRSIYIFI